jgi:hypothetical protein
MFRRNELGVRHAVPFLEQHAVAASDEHGTCELVRADQRREVRVDVSRERRLGSNGGDGATSARRV